MLDELESARTQGLVDNTAQAVFKHLRDLELKRSYVLTRWIWELLQNAHDTSSGNLVASIRFGQGELVFQHNGLGFKPKQIFHLIYHGSTKTESDDAVGQFGSGFLTTHLLSPKIEVSGQLEDGRSFEFCLDRSGDSFHALGDSMERSWYAFKDSLSSSTESTSSEFTTRFRYPVGDGETDAVKKGIEALKQCGPFVVAFNQKFSRIEIHSEETENIREIERKELKERLWQVTVARSGNGTTDNIQEYLVVEGQKSSISVPLKSAVKTPRLFLGFPLIGTEKFSFPAIINSFEFTPTEERDGVFLGQDDKKEICENKLVISEACGLLVYMLQFVGSSGWNDAYTFATIPPIGDQEYLDLDWLRECLKEHLIEKVRQTPAVLCEPGVIPPKESILPFTEKDVGVEALWDLLDGLEEFRQKLPRRNEVVGWCKAVKSWQTVCSETTFDEAFDGRKLAERVGEECGSLEHLQELLREEVCAVKWLDRLYQFLKDDNLFDDKTRSLYIFPGQAGNLDELSNLCRDQDIAEELKDIAELLGWDIRRELRDKRLPSLANEVGAGNRDSEYVVGEIIKKLQERAENNPDDDFGKASVSLFAWIVGQKNLNLLRGFPVFAKESSVGGLAVAYLPRATQDSDRLLAPVLAWSEDLRPFDDLFPQNCILADAFFEAVPALDTWRILDEQGFVRTNIVIPHNVNFQKFFPDHPLPEGVHRTSDRVLVTDIVNRTEIMSRVRDSQSRARLFWRFLTEWLAKEDLQALESKKTECECGKTHRYYPAAWIEPLRENNWVRLGNEVRDYATAQSLANLLRDSGWDPNSLNANPAAVKLLEAIGVTRFDLMRELVSKNDEERATMNDQLTYLITATGGNLNHVREFVEDMQNDEELPDILKKRREDRQMVQKNQHLGKRVEELVKESLGDEGFTVTRTGIGSDYEIELSSGDQSWLVEVKSTQGQEVRMTDTQARKAVEKEDGFLLCVVPVESETPALDEVQDKMRFVENIGSLVEPLCNGLDEFEDLRDEITDDKSSGVQLVVEAGTARVRVTSSVWQDGSFPLAELSNRLQ